MVPSCVKLSFVVTVDGECVVAAGMATTAGGVGIAAVGDLDSEDAEAAGMLPLPIVSFISPISSWRKSSEERSKDSTRREICRTSSSLSGPNILLTRHSSRVVLQNRLGEG